MNFLILVIMIKNMFQFWADKKSTVRSKVVSSGCDPNNLCSNIEKKIWDLFLANDTISKFLYETNHSITRPAAACLYH